MSSDLFQPSQTRPVSSPRRVAASSYVEPAAEDRVPDPRGQSVEEPGLPQLHLAPARVAEHPHEQVGGRVVALDHDPGAVGEQHPLDGRAGAPVVVDGRAAHCGVEDRGIHGSIVLVSGPPRSPRVITGR
jgi:hypothetical protein